MYASHIANIGLDALSELLFPYGRPDWLEVLDA